MGTFLNIEDADVRIYIRLDGPEKCLIKTGHDACDSTRFILYVFFRLVVRAHAERACERVSKKVSLGGEERAELEKNNRELCMRKRRALKDRKSFTYVAVVI